MITEIEQQTLDIDWFFTNSEDIAFVASGGGKLPESVAKSWDRSNLLSAFFEDLLITSEVIITPNLSEIISRQADDSTSMPLLTWQKRDFLHMIK